MWLLRLCSNLTAHVVLDWNQIQSFQLSLTESFRCGFATNQQRMFSIIATEFEIGANELSPFNCGAGLKKRGCGANNGFI